MTKQKHVGKQLMALFSAIAMSASTFTAGLPVNAASAEGIGASVFVDGEEADGQIVNVGDELTYSIAVHNDSTESTVAKVTDVVPNSITVTSADNDGTAKSGAVAWTVKLAAGETKDLTFNAKVNDGTRGKTIENKVSALIGTKTYNADAITNYVLTEPVKTVTTASGKNADDEFIANGEELIYEIRWTNPSNSDVDLTIEDALPDGLKVIETAPAASETDGTLYWDLTAAGGEEVFVTAKVQTQADDGASIAFKNAATVNVNGYAIDSNTTKTYIPTITQSADKEDSVVNAGDEITYTIHVSNPSEKSAKAVITDTFPENTEFVSASDKGFYKVADDGASIAWTYSMPADTDKDFTVTVKATKAGVIYENRASMAIGANKYEYDAETVKSYVAAAPTETVLDESGTDINGKVFARSNDDVTLVYKIEVQNPADVDKTFAITAPILKEMTFVEASDHGTFDKTANAAVWELDVAAGEKRSVTTKVTVPGSISVEKITSTATVSVDDYTNTTNETIVYVTDKPVKNAVSKTTTTSTTASTSAKTINNGMVVAGETFSYDITWSNPTTETKVYNVTDELPEEVTFVEASDKGEESDGVVTWKNISVGAGESKTVTVAVTVNKKITDRTFGNTAKIEISGDKAHYYETTTESKVYAGKITNTVRKTEDGDNIYNDLVSDGETFVYDTFVYNESGKDQTITVTNTVPSTLKISSASEEGEVSGQTVTWENITVPKGGIHLYTNVTVNAGAQAAAATTSKITNTAKMTSKNGGSLTSNSATVYVMPKPTKSVQILTVGEGSTSTAGASSDGNITVHGGDVVKYTIHQTNTSGDARYFTITDDVDARLVVSNVTGSGKVNGNKITWTAYIAAGGTVDLTFDATVPATDKAIMIDNVVTSATCNASCESNTVELNVAAPEKASAADSASTGSTTDGTASAATGSTTGTTTGTTSGTSSTVTSRATGDASNMTLWIAALCVAAAGIAGVVIFKRKKAH